jgi:hypothetical protein
MIIDCRSEEFRNNPERLRRRVYVDGVEILAVWYVDTDAGFVRTYGVLENTDPISSRNLSKALIERGEREGWDIPADGGPVSKTVYGRVELRPF